MSEFSIPYAISQFPVINELRYASDSHKRITFGRLLKNAIILQTMGVKRGRYKIDNPAPVLEHAEDKLASNSI